jgi:hypothetical protein
MGPCNSAGLETETFNRASRNLRNFVDNAPRPVTSIAKFVGFASESVFNRVLTGPRSFEFLA